MDFGPLVKIWETCQKLVGIKPNTFSIILLNIEVNFMLAAYCHKGPVVTFEMAYQPDDPSNVIKTFLTEPEAFYDCLKVEIICLLCRVDSDLLSFLIKVPCKSI